LIPTEQRQQQQQQQQRQQQQQQQQQRRYWLATANRVEEVAFDSFTLLFSRSLKKNHAFYGPGKISNDYLEKNKNIDYLKSF
jgi:hypothetical protein